MADQYNNILDSALKEAAQTGQWGQLIRVLEAMEALNKKLSEKLKSVKGLEAWNADTAADITALQKAIQQAKKQLRRHGYYKSAVALDTNITDGGKQLSMRFDELDNVAKGRVEQLKINKSSLFVGVNMGAGGIELLEAFNLLLQQQSANTTNPNSADYYGGRADEPDGGKLVKWQHGGQVVAASGAYIKTNLTELCRIITGEDKPSKWARDRVAALLDKYNNQPYLIRYTEEREEVLKNGKTRRKIYEVRTAEPLFKAVTTEEKTTGKSSVQIILKPLFFQQIAKQHNLKPVDYLQRVRREYMIAAGNGIERTPPDTLYFFLTLLIEATGRESRLYNVKKSALLEQIAPKEWKKRERGAAAKILNQYIEVAKRIGLLASVEDYTNADGEEVLLFHVTEKGYWEGAAAD